MTAAIHLCPNCSAHLANHPDDDLFADEAAWHDSGDCAPRSLVAALDTARDWLLADGVGDLPRWVVESLLAAADETDARKDAA